MTPDLPLVSAIIPVYNNEKYIADAIDSVLSQDYAPLELIVVDDGSIDESPSVIAEYGDRLRYVRQENQGPAAARNNGIGLAIGELIAMLDSDDKWAPGKLTTQVVYLTAHPDRLAVVGKIRHFIEPGAEETAEYRKEWLATDFTGYHLGTLLAYKSLFENIGELDSAYKYADDVDWFLRLKDQNIEPGEVDDVVMLKRLHGESITNRQEAQNKDLLKALRRSLKRGAQEN
jgi:glycosyltransferase involved in cell wall biosynthesis